MKNTAYEPGDQLTGAYVTIMKHSQFKKSYTVIVSHTVCDKELNRKEIYLNELLLPNMAIRQGCKLIRYGISCKIKNLFSKNNNGES